MTQIRDLLLTAFAKHNVPSDLRAGIAAICGGESELKSVRESSYAHTSNDRLRNTIFPSRLGGLSDAALDQLKADDRAFFEKVYGGRYGNDQPGDGYKYRGGGINQETFKDNYRADGEAIGIDLVANPERILEPAIAVEVAVVYMLRNYHGGGWDAMKRAVGNSFGTPDARKDQLWAQYRTSREWDAPPPENAGQEQAGDDPHASSVKTGPTPAPQPSGAALTREPTKEEADQGLDDVQAVLYRLGLYKGKIDHDWGTGSKAAWKRLLELTGNA